jgi:hypothetical protein
MNPWQGVHQALLGRCIDSGLRGAEAPQRPASSRQVPQIRPVLRARGARQLREEVLYTLAEWKASSRRVCPQLVLDWGPRFPHGLKRQIGFNCSPAACKTTAARASGIGSFFTQAHAHAHTHTHTHTHAHTHTHVIYMSGFLALPLSLYIYIYIYISVAILAQVLVSRLLLISFPLILIMF